MSVTPATPDPIKDEQMINDAFRHLLDTYLASNHRKKTEVITKAFNFAKKAHSGSDKLVAAAAEAKKPIKVMATWIVARNWPESLASCKARAERLSPSSASFWSKICFALTKAISDMEK